MKKRKRYLRVHGHRQQFTEIEIGKIESGKAKKAAATPSGKAAKKEAPAEKAA